jgi:ABC-2 type transport system permease protein
LADQTLREVARSENLATSLRMLETGQAAVLLVVPHGFARDLTRGRATHVQVVLDGSDPNRANVAAAAVSSYLAGESEQRVRAAQRRALALGAGVRAIPALEVRSRVLFNPELKTAVYMVPGVTGMLLLLITTIVSAMGLARERERGTLEQILVTPVPGGVLVLGKILPFAAFGLFDFLLAMTVGAYLFGMPLRGSVAVLLLATCLYLSITLAVGLLISTFSANQQQAFMGGFLFMLPAALLSGIMTPVRSMPEVLQWLTLINPLRHYAEILRGVLLRGASGLDLSAQLGALLVMALLTSGVSASRFVKTQG